MTIRYQFSKTNLFGRAYAVYLFSTHTLTCPVAAMKRHLSLKKYDPHGPLLCLGYGISLIHSKFVQMLHFVLKKLGFQPTIYPGHSFRIGAATRAAATSILVCLIKALGRWSSECYIRGIHTKRKSQQPLTLSMAQASNVW